MKTIAIVGARLNSNRLPKKHLQPLNGIPLIQRLCDRLKRCEKLDNIILATTDDDFNKALLNWANDYGIPCYAHKGDVNDLVGRIDALTKSEAPDYLCYICGDSPLVEPNFIDHALTQLQEDSEKEIIGLKPSVSTIHEGMAFYSRLGWARLVKKSTTPATKEHVGHAHNLSPFLNVKFIDDSDDYSSIIHRISVDTPADLKFMQEVYRRWYSENPINSIVDLHWLQHELLQHADLRDINVHVIQKQADTRYKKVALYCHVSEDIGLGHVSRCAKIACSLQETLGLSTHIHIHGIECKLPWLNSKVSWHTDQNELMKNITTEATPLLIIDFHPDFTPLEVLHNALREYKNKGARKVIALDKMDSLLSICDALFIPSFYSQHSNPKVSFGWDHYFIKKIQCNAVDNEITILTGGSDALGFGKNLPSILERAVSPEILLTWVQGPYALRPKLPTPERWGLIVNPTHIQPIISRSSIVLSTYGLSLFESIANAQSVIALPPRHLCSENELSALERSKSCLIARDFDEIDSSLKQLIGDKELRKNLRKQADTLFSDKNGFDLFCELIQEEIRHLE